MKKGTSKKKRPPAKSTKTSPKKGTKKHAKKKKVQFRSLFEGRLVPALMVVVPLIVASVSIIVLTDKLGEQEEAIVKESSKELSRESPEQDRESPEQDPDERQKPSTPDSSIPEKGEKGGSEKDISEEKVIPEDRERRGTLYLIIDDVGYETRNLDMFLSLPFPVTYAVLPGLARTGISVEKIDEKGDAYILHQPMEPIGEEDPGPGALHSKMSEKDVEHILKENLKEMPDARGINNHMGSKATTNQKLMKSVLNTTKEEGLFYLDSKTTSDSVVREIAKEERVDFTERHVFLDNESSKEYIREALEEAKTVADLNGYAVLIGHIWSRELYEVLEDHYPSLRREGFAFEYITDLFHKEAADAGSGG